METTPITGTVEFQELASTIMHQFNNPSVAEVAKRRAISPRVDRVELSVAKSASITPTEPDTPTILPIDDTAPVVVIDKRVTIEEKNPAKEMFMSADPHEQVAMASNKIAKDQMALYAEVSGSNSEEESRATYSDSTVTKISISNINSRAVEAYRQQSSFYAA